MVQVIKELETSRSHIIRLCRGSCSYLATYTKDDPTRLPQKCPKRWLHYPGLFYDPVLSELQFENDLFLFFFSISSPTSLQQSDISQETGVYKRLASHGKPRAFSRVGPWQKKTNSILTCQELCETLNTKFHRRVLDVFPKPHLNVIDCWGDWKHIWFVWSN